MKFPDYFPEGCPPADATEAVGDVFRIVRAGEIGEADFRSHHELGIALGAPACARCGVSLFDSFDGAMHRRRLSPYLGAFISHGRLAPSAGKMKLTKPSSGHIEWWAFEGTKRSGFFEAPLPCE